MKHHACAYLCTHNDIELGVDVDDSLFRVDDGQCGDSSADEHVDCIDQRSVRCRLHQHSNQSYQSIN